MLGPATARTDTHTWILPIGTPAMRCILTLLISLLILSGCQQSSEPPPEAPAHIPWVKTVELKEAGPTAQRFSGTLRGRHEVPQAFQIAGRVQQRFIDPGQRVEKGDLLFKLDTRDLAATAVGAAADLKRAEAALAIATNELQRQQQLVERQFVSEQTLQRLELAEREARSQLETASSRNKQAQNALGYAELKASNAGVITEVSVEPGQVVGIGQTLAVLAADQLLEVEVFLPEGINPPRRGYLPLANGKQIAMNLREIAGAADPRSRSWRARYSLEGPYPSSLTLGSVVSVRLAQKQTESSHRVPLGALDERGQTPQVWLVSDGTVNPLAVEVIDLGKEYAEIKVEINAGTSIVALGTHLLTRGMAVRELTQ
ncbi:efflux transporter, RND family, MFP subunit [Marinobacter adhaerens HP15]|uniref:Efflux transporter, RND family, MFP subunit n=2 Tax=Marinobacter adhaerens TaxID=1033846 RepID=E4PGU7_MARAH|nr:efflux transporter, RND family, MFP subunit [Marinobacter adhaerens HP15]